MMSPTRRFLWAVNSASTRDATLSKIGRQGTVLASSDGVHRGQAVRTDLGKVLLDASSSSAALQGTGVVDRQDQMVVQISVLR